MKKTLSLLAASVVMLSANAQTFSPTLGDNASLDQQVIGDTNANADRTNSTSNQIGNSANANGAQLGVTNDTRDQNTVTSTGGAASGGSATGNLSNNDNRSSVGNTSASNGPQTMGQANTGNSSVGNTTTGPSTATTGASTSNSGGNTTTSQGGTGVGLGGDGGKGGTGGTASSTGTNLGINGQQQGIAGSGNSTTDVKNTAAQGQQQGIDRSGNSANTNTAGGNTGGNSANRNSMTGGAQNSAQTTNAGNGAGAGAGSGNRTSLATGAQSFDLSDRSNTSYTDNSRAVAWAPVIHGPAAPALAAANLVVVPGKCGPRMMIVTRDIIGQRFKSLLPDSTFNQTTTDRLVPLTDSNGMPVEPFERRGDYLMGHEATILATTVGTSTAGSISLGLFGKGGDAGQGGSSSSGSVQQIVKEIELRDCVFAMAVAAPQPPVVIPPVDRTHGPAPKADRN